MRVCMHTLCMYSCQCVCSSDQYAVQHWTLFRLTCCGFFIFSPVSPAKVAVCFPEIYMIVMINILLLSRVVGNVLSEADDSFTIGNSSHLLRFVKQ